MSICFFSENQNNPSWRGIILFIGRWSNNSTFCLCWHRLRRNIFSSSTRWRSSLFSYWFSCIFHFRPIHLRYILLHSWIIIHSGHSHVHSPIFAPFHILKMRTIHSIFFTAFVSFFRRELAIILSWESSSDILAFIVANSESLEDDESDNNKPCRMGCFESTPGFCIPRKGNFLSCWFCHKSILESNTISIHIHP